MQFFVACGIFIRFDGRWTAPRRAHSELLFCGPQARLTVKISFLVMFGRRHYFSWPLHELAIPTVVEGHVSVEKDHRSS